MYNVIFLRFRSDKVTDEMIARKNQIEEFYLSQNKCTDACLAFVKIFHKGS